MSRISYLLFMLFFMLLSCRPQTSEIKTPTLIYNIENVELKNKSTHFY